MMIPLVDIFGLIIMSRTFIYSRVSTSEQTTENQRLELESKGYTVPTNRFISETISGGVPAMQRPEFAKLVDKLEDGDKLVVLKIDRLGRDNIDVQQTIKMLMKKGIEVKSLDLPDRDLASSDGQLVLQMFTAFAEFEKAKIAERTKAGLNRCKANGVKLGRPVATETTRKVQEYKAKKMTQSEIAKLLKCTVLTVKRHWNKEV